MQSETGSQQNHISRNSRALAPSSGDSLRKREEACQVLRKGHRQMRISKKRETEQKKICSDSLISLSYINARGINSRKKQSQLQQLIQYNNSQINITALSETKLTSRMNLAGFNSIQTTLSRSGGCWLGGPIGSSKNIKSLGSAISWMCVAIESVPVHFICCYFAPNCKAKTDESLARLKHLINSLLERGPSSRIVMMGDFNERVGEVENFMVQKGISAIIPKEMATHNIGGTNLPVENWTLYPVDFSDHCFFRAQLRFKYKSDDMILGKIQSNTSQTAMRKMATSDATAQKMREVQGRLINIQAKSIYQPYDMQKNKQIRWYKQPSREELEALKLHTPGNSGNAETLQLSSEQKWRDKLSLLHEYLKQNDTKNFYKLATDMTRVKMKHNPVRALTNDIGETLHEKNAIESELAHYYRSINSSWTEVTPPKEELLKPLILYTQNDLVEAIDSTNFEKAIGDDGFDGLILQKHHDLKSRIAQELADALNTHSLPAYLRVGRLVPLSKKAGDAAVTTDEIRPIVVKSHLTKIAERAILNKIQNGRQHLLRTSFFQRDFKEDSSTADNLTKVLSLSKKSFSQAQTSNNSKLLLFIDLKKAYDKVDRSKMIEVLKNRCQDEVDMHILGSIGELHLRQSIVIGEHEIITYMGVAQGSILSPFLFNIYLEAAIFSSPLLKHLTIRGDLLAYADDMALFFSCKDEAMKAINEIESLADTWNIQINKAKSEFLVKTNSPYITNSKGIADIQCKSKVKYLGVPISLEKDQLFRDIKAAIRKNLGAIKGRLRGAEIAVKEQLLMSHVKSLLIYFGTPMVASGIWKDRHIESIEKELFKELMLLPNDVNRGVVVNIVRQGNPSQFIVMKLANKVKQRIARQNHITDYATNWKPEAETRPPKIKKLYVPKILAEIIIAISRNSTCVNYGYYHLCLEHNCQVNVEHIYDCLKIPGRDEVVQILKRLKQENIRCWHPEEIQRAVLLFAFIQLRIKEQEAQSSWLLHSPSNQPAKPAAPADKADVIMTEPSSDPINPCQQPKKRGRPKKIAPPINESDTLNRYFAF